MSIPSPDTVSLSSSSLPGQSLVDWLLLSFLPGVGCTLANRLVCQFGSPGNVLSASVEQLLAVDGVGPQMARTITDPAHIQTSRERARREIENAAEKGFDVMCPGDNLYPDQLRSMPDPPVALFCRGNLQCLERPAIAMVGSRAATAYGKRVSFELARELVRHGICVVSGMAMGVDGEAHAGALAGGGATIGVLGCGIDVVYPHQHAELFAQVGDKGLLMSEYPLGTGPEGFRFPERNRIISGMSLGTVVVEASVNSGSLITASLAIEQGREVFGVPGRIDSAKSRGVHRLLQQGAKLVTCVDDILEELELAGIFPQDKPEVSSSAQAISLLEEEQRLLSCLDVYPVTIDELVRESGLEAGIVFQMLLGLELKGVVRQLPGQQYELQKQAGSS